MRREGGITLYEVHLNQKTINSIDAPKQMDADAGTDLEIRLVNHGHPVHVTLSANNAQPFTSFIHENLFIDDELEYKIPIKKDAVAGFFDMEIITGYGTKRAKFRIVVHQTSGEKVEKKEETAARASPAAPTALKIPQPSLLLAGAGLVMYLAWFAVPSLIALNILAFLALLAAFVMVWYRRPS